MPDLTLIRQLALSYAVDLHARQFGSTGHSTESDNQNVTRTATVLFAWLTGPIALILTVGQVLDQTTHQPTGNNQKGTRMQLHDTEQVDLTVEVADAKGVAILDDPGSTSDNLTWSITDTNVASLAISADTRTCTVVAGMPGSAVGTVALGELSATFAVDVVAGAAATIAVTEGTAVAQPPASAPADQPAPVTADQPAATDQPTADTSPAAVTT